MFVISFVEDDNLNTIEITAKENETLEETRTRANLQYFELKRPGVSERKTSVNTVDIQFIKGGKVYTYFVNRLLTGYSKAYIKDNTGDYRTVDIISSKRRTVSELIALAESKGFKYEDFKVLHGIAIL